jgi:hypothetical protein
MEVEPMTDSRIKNKEKKFIVRARRTMELQAEVWAESGEEALEIAENESQDWQQLDQDEEVYEVEEA